MDFLLGIDSGDGVLGVLVQIDDLLGNVSVQRIIALVHKDEEQVESSIDFFI